MRFRLARRIALAPALALALALTAAACTTGASASSPASSSASAPASAPASSGASSGSPAGGSAAAVAQITANWEKFFNSSTPVAEKAALLQDGNVFKSAIDDFINFPMASGLEAKVTNVTLDSATTATVHYDLTANGQELLPGQTGKAVLQGGTWKVGDASLCSLFKLIPGGTIPAACRTVS